MKIHNAAVWLMLILPTALPAQTPVQIGGGACSTASLTGLYSLTLSGRDVSSSVTFSKALQGIGTASFDGLSAVTFTFTGNTNGALGVAQTLSGTYSMQSNCAGTLNIANGDTASFSLSSYNQGRAFLLTGQDGIYSFTGSGSALPASCGTALLNGVYAFNGNGFALSSGAIAGVNNISGLLTFDGKGAVTGVWYLAASGGSTTVTTSGQFTVNSGCTAAATLSSTLGTVYNLVFTITSTNGSNFIVAGSNTLLMFSGSGRTI